jgi:hypothetical protein
MLINILAIEKQEKGPDLSLSLPVRYPLNSTEKEHFIQMCMTTGTQTLIINYFSGSETRSLTNAKANAVLIKNAFTRTLWVFNL